MPLYVGGRRRIGPPLVFGAGVLRHLLAARHDYDVVHSASFPFFSPLAAALVRPFAEYRLVIDWHELWTRDYWREYLGPVGGLIGWLVQLACVRIPHSAFCFSRLHARRLVEEGHRGPVTVLEGQYAESLEAADPEPAEPLVVFAGRHIPEKRVPALVPALARARERVPELRGEIYGDGPDRPEVDRQVAEHGLDGAVSVRGFAPSDEVDRALRRALCLVLPSRREGYGKVVVEASARGTPSVLVRDPDNAATELVEEGVNGFVASSSDPEALAEAILRVHHAGPALRRSTADWFARNAQRLSIDRSLEAVARAYGSAIRPAR
jgi:glycosyltransferase involved in cell wall biosynthesis